METDLREMSNLGEDLGRWHHFRAFRSRRLGFLQSTGDRASNWWLFFSFLPFYSPWSLLQILVSFTGTVPYMLPLSISLLTATIIKIVNRIRNTLFSSSWYALKASFLRLKKGYLLYTSCKYLKLSFLPVCNHKLPALVCSLFVTSHYTIGA